MWKHMCTEQMQWLRDHSINKYINKYIPLGGFTCLVTLEILLCLSVHRPLEFFNNYRDYLTIHCKQALNQKHYRLFGLGKLFFFLTESQSIWDLSSLKFAQSCPTLCDPMDYTVHGILQARILEWVAFPFSRRSSRPRDQTQVSRIAGRFFISWATRETP